MLLVVAARRQSVGKNVYKYIYIYKRNMNIYFRPTSRFGHDFIFEQRGGCEKASPRNDQLARQNENQKP